MVLHSGQGAQGILRKPSQQQLDTVFGTHNDVEVVAYILENGKLQHSDTFASFGTLNNSRGSTVDTRGSKGTSGI